MFLKVWTMGILLGAAGVAGAAAPGACRTTSPARTQVLVELYTSQGCSSCPPADHWLSQLDVRASTGVVPLALHVGYWDYIGWKDPYARREFNDRQRWLAGLNHNGTVYTPGVFVQARETPRWYAAGEFRSAAGAIGESPARAKIELLAERSTGDTVKVNADATLATGINGADARLFIALTESGLDTKVKAGENRGATLRNDHVVRDWSGALPLGAQAVTLAGAGADLAVVAFVQDVRSGEVLQAVRLPLGACSQ